MTLGYSLKFADGTPTHFPEKILAGIIEHISLTESQKHFMIDTSNPETIDVVGTLIGNQPSSMANPRKDQS
mgnify:CR=1 FL=1